MGTRRIGSIGSILLSAALGASILVQTPSVQASSAGTFNCKAAFDAYKVDQLTRQSCGIHTWPLTETGSLAGGGREYVYNLNGHKTVYHIPPAGFDPLKASATELAKYFLPARPSGGAALARWTDMMSKSHFVTPPSFLVTLPYSAGIYHKVWSGYDTTNTGTWFAEAKWNEISVGSSCSGSTALTWAGIGGDLSQGSHLLAQAGTEVGVGGGASHSAWWQVVPDFGGIQPISGVVAHPGYGFITYTEWDPGAYEYYFYVQDTYSGNTSSFGYYTHSWDGIGADFIIERGQNGATPTPLTNYYYLNFLYAEVNGTGSGHYLSNYPNRTVTMTSDGTSTGRLLSYVSQSVGSVGQFQTHYGSYCS